MAFIVRALVDAIEAAGSKNVAAHRAALDLIDACVRGDQPTPAAIQAARDAVTKACARYANAYKLPPVQAALYAVPIINLLWMVESGQDVSAHMLDGIARAVVDADASAARRRVEELRAQGAAHAAAIDDAPFAPRTKRANARTRAIERALIERSRAALSGDALALFDEIRPARDPKKTANRAALAKILKKLAYPASEAVLAFEAAFGGLLIPVTNDDEWREDNLNTLVGPWAIFESGFRWTQPDGDAGPLVPVACGLQDEVYLLDERGVPWYHDPTGDAYVVPFGANGAELVTRLVFAAFTYASHAPQGTALWPPVDRARAAAATLHLERLFADEMTEWWYGPSAIVVVFRGKVHALARTDEAAAALRA